MAPTVESKGIMDFLNEFEMVGMLLMFSGVILLCFAFRSVMRDKWKDYAMLAKGLKLFRESRDKNGKHDFAAFYPYYPSSTSELIGDVQSHTGAVAKALSMPALILWMIGATCITLGTARGAGFATIVCQFFRMIMPPTGLFIVLLTPVISLGESAYYGNKGQTLAEYCSAMDKDSWFRAHGLGAGLVIAGLPLIELPAALYTSYVFVTHTMWDERGDPSNIVGMLIFHALRVFLIVTAIKMVQTMAEIMHLRADTGPEAQMRNYKMNINESAALVHACLIQALNASPIINNPELLFTGITVADYSASELVAEGSMTVLFCYFLYVIISNYSLPAIRFDSVDWAGVKRAELEADWPPMHKGLARLVTAVAPEGTEPHGLWSMTILQAGEQDSADLLRLSHAADRVDPNNAMGVGMNMPKIRQFVIFPKMLENYQAADVDAMGANDLREFNRFIASVLTTLPGSDTLYLPMGSTAKHMRAVPLVYVSCADHAAAVAALDGSAKANVAHATPTTDELAIDITDRILASQPSLLKGRTFVEALQSGPCAEMWADLCSLMTAESVHVPGVASYMEATYHELTSPCWYELQVRGVLSKAPRFVLRTHKDHLPSLKGVSVPPTPTNIECYPSYMLKKSKVE